MSGSYVDIDILTAPAGEEKAVALKYDGGSRRGGVAVIHAPTYEPCHVLIRD